MFAPMRLMMFRFLVTAAAPLTVLALLATAPAVAQGYVDQPAVAALLDVQGTGDATPVSWHTYPISSSDKTVKAVERRLKAHLDSLPGDIPSAQRLQVVELSNRVRSKYLLQRRSLLVPNRFPADFRAYSPYPARYAGAAPLPKLFVIDKGTQTFAAYEGGELVRWGLISTGSEDDLTPGGRYTFNWSSEYRLSTAAPEGETWELRWVWNFHGPKGIHVHQYALPIAQAASHGCVRLTEADAKWNYYWAEKGTTVVVLNASPVGLASHWLEGAADRPVSLVYLPNDPMDVPLGIPGEKEKEVAVRN